MNEVATRSMGTGLISREDLAKALGNAAMSMPSVGGDKQFLKMDRGNGDWLYGQEETLVEKDALWALDPTSLRHGWVAWDTNGGGAPVQEIMVPVTRPLPALESLPPLGMGTPDKKTGKAEQLEYQQQRSADFTCISGEDEGVVVEYKQSSKGAMKLFGALINTLLDQLQKGKDEIVAIGSFGSEPYKHTSYGRIFNPKFNIAEWRTMDDTAPPEAKAAEPEAAPARTRTRTAAPAETAADVEEQYKEEAAAEQAAPRRRMRRV